MISHLFQHAFARAAVIAASTVAVMLGCGDMPGDGAEDVARQGDRPLSAPLNAESYAASLQDAGAIVSGEEDPLEDPEGGNNGGNGPPEGIPCKNVCLSTLLATKQRVDLYEYQGEYVYFAVANCCDIPNAVLTTHCQYICSPSGGITGGGAGDCPEDFADATYLGLIQNTAYFAEVCGGD